MLHITITFAVSKCLKAPTIHTGYAHNLGAYCYFFSTKDKNLLHCIPSSLDIVVFIEVRSKQKVAFKQYVQWWRGGQMYVHMALLSLSHSVECSAGTYFDADSKTCKYCAVGQYQENVGQTDCTQCPDDETTETYGSVSASDCFSKCRLFFYIHSYHRGHPCCSGSTLDCWATGWAIDRALGAWFITISSH